MQTSFTAQFENAIELLTSPAGAFAMIAWLGLLIALVFNPRVKWPVLVLLMWVSTLGFYVLDKMPIPLAVPLNQIRSYGRPIGVLLLIALLVPAVLSNRGWRMRLLGAPVVLLFVFEMLLAMRIAAAGVTDRALVSMVVYPLLFITFGWGLSKWIQSWKDANNVLRAIMMAGFLFLITTIYQLVINRSAILRGNRLSGTTGNPQHAALLIGGSLPLALYFLARAKENKIFRILAGFTAGFLALFLLWTGSRTGILMAAVGIALTFRARIGKFVAVSIFAGLVVLMGIQIYEESTIGVVEMWSRGDTRTRVWASMWNAFLENPAFGAMSGEYGVGENSYLSTAASMGLFGFLPLMTFVAVTLIALLKLHRVRKLLGDERPIVDAITGGVVALFVSAMFEGHLLGTLTFQVFALYSFCALITFVQDAARMEQYQRSLELESPHEQYEQEELVPAGFAQPNYV